MLRLLTLATCIFVGVHSPFADTDHPCRSDTTPPPGYLCHASLKATLETFIRQRTEFSVRYGKQLADEASAIDRNLKQSRAHFSRVKPGTPEYLNAWHELSANLFLKDLWYLVSDLQPTLASSRLREPDGGIRTAALRAFEVWSHRVSELAGANRHQLGIFDELIQVHSNGSSNTLTNALLETEPLYERYRLERDWLEFASAGRQITDDPELYTKYLLAMERPWSQAKLSQKEDLADRADAYYESLQELFGRDIVTASAARVMSIPKNENGSLEPPYNVDGYSSAIPYHVFKALLGATSDKAYVLMMLLTTNANAARAAYARLITNHGEKAVLEAAHRIKTARKTQDGNIEDVKSLGITRARLDQALEDLLRKRSSN